MYEHGGYPVHASKNLGPLYIRAQFLAYFESRGYHPIGMLKTLKWAFNWAGRLYIGGRPILYFCWHGAYMARIWRQKNWAQAKKLGRHAQFLPNFDGSFDYELGQPWIGPRPKYKVGLKIHTFEKCRVFLLSLRRPWCLRCAKSYGNIQ